MKHLYLICKGFVPFFLIFLASKSFGQTLFDSNVPSGNWNAAPSWTQTGGPADGDGIPDAGDFVTILSGHDISVTIVEAASTLTINSGGTLTGTSGSLTASTITISSGGTLTGSGGSVTGTTFNVNSGGTLTTSGAYAVSGTTLTVAGLFTNGSSGAITFTTINVNAGGTYDHAQDGGVVPAATWAATSNCTITGITNNVPTGFAQTFGNLIWNSPGQLGTGGGGAKYMEADVTVQGDFRVLDTNVSSVRMSNTVTPGGDYTMNVLGDVLVAAAGTFKMNNSSGVCIMNVTGNLTVSGGEFGIVTGPASSTLNVTGNVTVSSGRLLMEEDNNAVTGTLNLSGDLTHTGGTIEQTGVPNGAGLIVFNGGGAQTYTSGGTVSNTINFIVNQAPANTVTLLTPTSFPANLTITAGTFDTNGQTVTFDGTIAQTISGTATSQTFDDVVVNKTVATLLNTGGSI